MTVLPSTLERRNFHALTRKGDVVQYWLAVEVVLSGLPGREAVPRGHWERLVNMAGEVAVLSRRRRIHERGEEEADRQLVTGWCHVDEPVGGG